MNCKKCVNYYECEKTEHIEHHLMNSGCFNFRSREDYTKRFLIIINSILAGIGIFLLIKYITL